MIALGALLSVALALLVCAVVFLVSEVERLRHEVRVLRVQRDIWIEVATGRSCSERDQL